MADRLRPPSPEEAWSLARDPDPVVRFELAACHRLPPEIVDVLSHDEDVEVVAAVAASQGLPPPLAAEFAGHPAPEVRRSLLINVHIEQSAPTRDMAADLAVLAARNPRTPHTEVLAEHATAFVREEVLTGVVVAVVRGESRDAPAGRAGFRETIDLPAIPVTSRRDRASPGRRDGR